jgi:hypothetical protein
LESLVIWKCPIILREAKLLFAAKCFDRAEVKPIVIKSVTLLEQFGQKHLDLSTILGYGKFSKSLCFFVFDLCGVNGSAYGGGI